MPELKFEHPHIPFFANIPGGLGVGRKIKIKGKAEYKHEPRFCINLGVAPMFRENIALHISPRHHENCIVVTHMNHGMWGVEQRLHNPIHSREHFEMEIHVEHESYKIKVYDNHLTSAPFVFPPHMVNHIEIEGGVSIEHVHIEGHSEMVAEPAMMVPGYRPPMVVEEMRPMMPGYGMAPMIPPVVMPPVVPPVMMPPMVPPVMMEPMVPPVIVEERRYPYGETVVVEERRPHNVVVVEPPIFERHHHHHGW